ncbi:hypothetical protein TW65_03501 [Stemphylium lycopersici]|nr:hypothetical protein TW65_03501 [Stemphylium lycopersici]
MCKERIMNISSTGAGSERDPMVVYCSDGDAFSEREIPTPRGKDKVSKRAIGGSEIEATKTKETKVISEDALLRAALDTDSEKDSDSELSDDPAPHACRDLVNKPLRSEERFFPHDTDPAKVDAFIYLKLPRSVNWYTQIDVLPEQRDSTEEDKYEENDTIFVPELLAYKCPPKFRVKQGNYQPRWIKVSDWGWERTKNGQTEVWVPRFVYRRFNARTHRYEHIYLAKKKMENVDPNDKKWVYTYNKWLDQIKRRSDSTYVQDKQRNHWTASEICAMYTGFNEYLHTKGIDAFSSMNNATFQPILDAINVAGNNIRSLEGLRGQIKSAHETKNASLAYLRDNMQGLMEYMELVGVISDDERFPKQSISPKFPSVPQTNTRRKKITRNLVHMDESELGGMHKSEESKAAHDGSDGVGASDQSSTSLLPKKRKRGMSDTGEEDVMSFFGGEKAENEAELRTDGDASSSESQTSEDRRSLLPEKAPQGSSYQLPYESRLQER